MYLVSFVEVFQPLSLWAVERRTFKEQQPSTPKASRLNATDVLPGTRQNWEAGEFYILRFSFILPIPGVKVDGETRVQETGKHGLKKKREEILLIGHCQNSPSRKAKQVYLCICVYIFFLPLFLFFLFFVSFITLLPGPRILFQKEINLYQFKFLSCQ